MEGKPMKARCTAKSGDGGNTMTRKCELSGAGSNWQTFWGVKAAKEVPDAA